MEPTLLGIHHVTAIADNPQRNHDFYTRTLGLRLVKLTVNFDDPGSYHFYFGDALGHPGTVLTFFPWPAALPGRIGTGQATATAFAAPPDSLGYWQERLAAAGLPVADVEMRFGEPVLPFADPDGLPLELVGGDGMPEWAPWAGSPVPPEYALRGFHGVTLTVAGCEQTATLLTQTLGWRRTGETDGRIRYALGAGGPGAWVDLVCRPDLRHGTMGAGVVHHVAWRAPDDAQQQLWHQAVAALGYNVSPVMDRQYFHSIYFREPGGVLFEIATDPPGFVTDEAPDALGTALQLPPQYEPYRYQIQRGLPPLTL